MLVLVSPVCALRPAAIDRREVGMAHLEWTIHAREFVNCNCAYGCPCQFNALPTHGHCAAVVGLAIDRGFHGVTRLDGLNVAVVLAWPGPIHDGKGEVQAIIDRRASPQQRDALLRILSGEDTKPGATIFQVFSTVIETVHEPIDADIVFSVDQDERVARLFVDGVIDSRGEPIRNPVTGAAHRARIELPAGFEYSVAEIGRGWSRATGAIDLSLADSHSQFAALHLSQDGVLR
jgi:hypothetical protein